MDDEELRKHQKQAERDEASQKTAHVAGKAAAAYFGGNFGAKAYDLASQTKVGQDIERAAGKVLQKNPGMNKAMEGLNKSGALDAADKGIDLSSKGQGKGLSKNGDAVTDDSEIKSNTKNKSRKKNEDNTFALEQNIDGQPASIDSMGKDEDKKKKKKKKRKKILSIISGFVTFFMFLLFMFLITCIYMPAQIASDFIKGLWDGAVDFFTTDKQELEQEFYQELKNVQQKVNKNYGVCIDVNLITAALMVNTNFEDMLESGQENVTDSIDNPNYNPDYGNGESEELEVSYKKMQKQINLLANMQIVNKKYSLNKSLKDETGYYCSNSSVEFLVDSTNQSSFDTSFFDWLNGVTDLDSSTPEKIADNDKGGLGAFFTKKSNEEKNYAYYIYQPSFNSDGTCTNGYAKDMLPSDKPELSIGDYATKTDSVFYWNLVNSFIPEYYSEYIPSSEPSRSETIKRIADDIYLLYDELGPSQTCGISYAGPSSLCPNGITVENVGTMDLEDYIAGVVSNEAYSSEGIEALKAQAVAARTYALYSTNYCQNSIANSTNAQTFTQNINDKSREATNATRGEILVDRDGKIFSSQYDSFCYDDGDCPDAKYSNGSYTVTYTKVPYGEKHTVTLSDSSQFNRITHGQGHARGMSQLVSYQLAKQGKSYKEILSYFYSDGVEISLVLSPTTTDGGEIIRGPITNYLAIDQFNNTIYDQVNKSGVGTREGVVAAATTLVSGFYSQTGYKLPYELYPSGKYDGYGVDSSWGTNTGRSDYPLNGLDCSGFISWAIHNGGFAYDLKNAQGWGNAGVSRPWTRGITDNSAQPGDLIYNKPPRENGTSGHIRMIIGVTNEGYVVAEASSKRNGVRITNVSFKSTGNYYLVDMSDYYATATKVVDYPM